MKRSPALVLCLLLSACGDPASNRSRLNKSKEPYKIKVAPGETYVAVLKPINQQVTDLISGAFTVNLDGDFIATNARVNNSLANTVHSQYIHLGHFCPAEIGDENQDGYIDAIEAKAYTSDVIIPLDGDLSSQVAEQGIFPLSDNWGAYVYSETSSYLSLVNDLYAPDENAEDAIVKLKEGVPLNLAETVVVIYGAPETLALPDTVATLPGLTRHQSIPIACGTFVKIESIPGEYENDDVTVGTIGSPNPRHPGQYPGRSGTPRPATPGSNNSETNNPQTNRPNNGTTSPQCPRDKICN